MKFLADSMLGKLAKYLRIIDVDAAYCPPERKREIVDMTVAEGRVLLTRNAHIAKELSTEQCYLVKSNDSRRQFQEVVRKFRLKLPENLFIRCIRCNTSMTEIAKEEVRGRVPGRTFRSVDSFRYCPTCEKIFWEGSHTRRMAREVVDPSMDV